MLFFTIFNIYTCQKNKKASQKHALLILSFDGILCE